MKISVEDGIILCSVEDEDRHWRFMYYGVRIFNGGYYKGKLKIKSLFGDDRPDREISEVEREEGMIARILMSAKSDGVEITCEAYKLLTERRAWLQGKIIAYKAEQAARNKVINEERNRRETWREKLEKGCGYCEYKRRCGDDQVCAASGDLLDEKNDPKYVNGRHYMFNYEAFPSENCPYKTE